MATGNKIALWSVIASAVVALAGVMAPVVAERIRWRNARAERLMTERIAAYADLIYELRVMESATSGRAVGRESTGRFSEERADRMAARMTGDRQFQRRRCVHAIHRREQRDPEDARRAVTDSRQRCGS